MRTAADRGAALAMALTMALASSVAMSGPSAAASEPTAEAGATADALPGSEAINSAVAFDGTNALVVWEDHRDGSGDIYGAMVSRSGTVLGTFPIAVSPNPGPGEYWEAENMQPDVSWNGQNYLVVWRSSGSSEEDDDWHDITAQLVTKAGALLGPPTQVGGMFGIHPSVTSLGTTWFVAWSDYDPWSSLEWSLRGRRIDASGAREGDEVVIAATSVVNPVAVTAGASYLVAWHQQGAGADGSTDVFYRQVSASGAALGADATRVTDQPGDQFGVDAAWNGSSTLLAWTDSRSGGNHDVYGARVTSSGTLVGAVGGFYIAKGSATQRQATVARSGSSNWLVAFASRGTGTFDIKGQRVTGSGGRKGGQITVSGAAGDQTFPEAVKAGTDTLVTFNDRRSGNGDIYGTGVTPAGGVRPAAGFPIG